MVTPHSCKQAPWYCSAIVQNYCRVEYLRSCGQGYPWPERLQVCSYLGKFFLRALIFAHCWKASETSVGYVQCASLECCHSSQVTQIEEEEGKWKIAWSIMLGKKWVACKWGFYKKSKKMKKHACQINTTTDKVVQVTMAKLRYYHIPCLKKSFQPTN